MVALVGRVSSKILKVVSGDNQGHPPPTRMVQKWNETTSYHHHHHHHHLCTRGFDPSWPSHPLNHASLDSYHLIFVLFCPLTADIHASVLRVRLLELSQCSLTPSV